MQIEESELRKTLKLVLQVEREHLFGVKIGSPSARKKELERTLDQELTRLVQRIETLGDHSQQGAQS